MLKKAWLVIKSGIPIWSRSANKKDEIDDTLSGAIIGALSMFSTTELGKPIKSVEIGGYVLNIRPFLNGDINLVIIGNRSINNNPNFLSIISQIDSALALLKTEIDINTDDTISMASYLEEYIHALDIWFDSEILKSQAKTKQLDQEITGLSSKLIILESLINKNAIGLLILDRNMDMLYLSATQEISEEKIKNISEHLKGWVSISSSTKHIIPELIFLKDIGIGIKIHKSYYIIVFVEWKGIIGDQEITTKIRSWLSQIARRLK